MKKVLSNAAKGASKWFVAVILAFVGYIGAGLIPIIVILKALHISAVGLMLFVVFLGLVGGACFYLLMRAVINKLLTGVFTPATVIIDNSKA